MAQNKTEWLAELVDRIHLIPINEVIGHYIELVPRGQHYMGLCPFHPDTSLGSFVVTPGKGIWHCFTDGIGGDAIRFVIFWKDRNLADQMITNRKSVNMDEYAAALVPAALEIAVTHGIISAEEYQQHTRKKYQASEIHFLAQKTDEPKLQAEQKKAPDYIIRNVYNLMPSVCGLNKKDKETLIRERGLTEDKLGDYFSFPDARTPLPYRIWMAAATNAAKQKGKNSIQELTVEEANEIEPKLQFFQKELRNVPGFYHDDIHDRDTFSGNRGIGFVVRDPDGIPVGITIRKYQVKPGEARYKWFSSSFALGQTGLSGGASPGAPGGVVYPKDMAHAQVVVTEGRFKAEAIAKKGNIAVYVSGVSSWKNVMRYLPALQKKGFAKKRIFIAFDADMAGNAAVHGALSGFCNALIENGLEPVLILWPKERGKGFDDMVYQVGNKYAKLLTYLPFAEFETKYEETLTAVMDKYEVASIREIPIKKREDFNQDLQVAIEKAVLKKTTI